MQLVCVSRADQEQGKLFAEDLASKLAFRCLGREELAELAVKEGIAVGKLETVIVKQRELNEREILEKEHYLAFVSRVLCERTLEGDVVYHGRAGHLAVPGLSHVLRIRTEIDQETQIDDVMRRLSVNRTKAKEYAERVGEDIDRWVRTMYNLGRESVDGFDLVVNLDRVGVESATTALCGYAQLPAFQATPASAKVLENLLLASRARIALARDERTWAARFNVRAEAGHVTVSYLPRDAAVGIKAPDVVAVMDGVASLTCTMASSNILWIQERYLAEGPTFEAVVKAAGHWHASVELMKQVPESATGTERADASAPEAGAEAEPVPLFTARRIDGGIEGDVQTAHATEDEADLRAVFHGLNARGIACSASRMPADMTRVGTAIDRTTPYSLVVVGDVFLDREHATRSRKT
ncbi:AAA family ATPase, partial [Acidobacteriota bacterium]